MKSDNLEFLEERRIKDLIKKHSEFISFPIQLQVEKTTEREISDDEDESEEKKDKKEDDTEIKDETDEKEKKKKKKKVKDVTTEFEVNYKENFFINKHHSEINLHNYTGPEQNKANLDAQASGHYKG
jgi:molecular chaperone HtpG